MPRLRKRSGEGGASAIAGPSLGDLLEIAPDAMVVVDQTGSIVLVNEQAERLFGYARDELTGHPVEHLVPERSREQHKQNLASYMADPAVRPMDVDMDLTALRKDGTEVPVQISLSPMETPEGTLVTAAIRDITKHRLLEVQAQAAREQAERANRAKSEFISRMSHELRTPLNSIIGFAELLALDRLAPGQRESVEQISNGARLLLQLVDEVPDISRIGTATMSISTEPVKLDDALAEALSMIRPLADEAGVRLTHAPPEIDDIHVLADLQRLKQVLLNLLSNAIKYNHPGGEVAVRCDLPSAGRVRIAVSDTGRGMSREQMERMYEPFERLGAEAETIEGTGLGLAVSKALVEAMGGTIEAESEAGAGTTMRVELGRVDAPEEVLDEGVPTVAAEPPRERRRVLCVEDDAASMRLVERALERIPDVRLLPAMQGSLGLELARDHRPDLILLDLHLPDMTGEELLRRLRADPATAERPVVVVSADATPGKIERLLAAGAADYLTKPLDIQQLLDVVSTMTSRD